MFSYLANCIFHFLTCSSIWSHACVRVGTVLNIIFLISHLKPLSISQFWNAYPTDAQSRSRLLRNRVVKLRRSSFFTPWNFLLRRWILFCSACSAGCVLSLPLSLSFGNPSSTKSCGGSESTAGGLPCSRAAAGAMQTKTAVRSAALTCAELAWWSPKLLTNSSSSPKMTNWRFDSSIVVEIVDKYLI